MKNHLKFQHIPCLSLNHPALTQLKYRLFSEPLQAHRKSPLILYRLLFYWKSLHYILKDRKNHLKIHLSFCAKMVLNKIPLKYFFFLKYFQYYLEVSSSTLSKVFCPLGFWWSLKTKKEYHAF